jgi:hypothetical protein
MAMTYGLATVAIGGRPQTVLVRGDSYVPLSHWGEARDLPALLGDWQEVTGRLSGWAADDRAFAAAASFAEADVRAP